MTASPDVPPRRLTGKDEAELLQADKRAQDAKEEAARQLAARDRLMLELSDSGVRISDIADVLGLTRNAVYAAIERAAREQ